MPKIKYLRHNDCQATRKSNSSKNKRKLCCNYGRQQKSLDFIKIQITTERKALQYFRRK